MEYAKLKTLEGQNLFGKKNIIYLKVEEKYREELYQVLSDYNNFTKQFNIWSELTILDSAPGYIEAYLICSRVEISRYIIDSLFKSESKEKINEIASDIISYDWSYYIEKQCDISGIPFIKIDNNNIQIGYGSNSVNIAKDDITKKNISKEIESIKLKDRGLIPIISVTGTNGKTTTVRLIHNILMNLGYNSGLSSTGGIYIGKEVIKHGDTTGFYSAREILKNKSINIAVLETARGGILKKGLGYESAKVAIITSISEDHIGVEGIKSTEDLANIKGIVANELREDGVLIIKAIDILFNRYKNRENVILFEYEKNNFIEEHIMGGKKAYYISNGYIVKEDIDGIEQLVAVKEIPFAFYGISKSNVKNVIAAIAAINEVHNNIKEIIEIVKKVTCDIYTNLGRQNLIDFNKFKMLIDYGHNSEAFEEVFSIAEGLKCTKITGVITAPGDREDKYIEELGFITAKYCDKIIIKEQPDLRGREIGETANILKSGALKAGFNEAKIEMVLSEEEAIYKALKEAIDGEVIVSFSQFLYLTFPVINKFRIENGMETIGEDLDLSH